MANSGYIPMQQMFAPEDMEFCKARLEGVSPFIRSLIEQDMKDPLPDVEPSKRSTRTNRGFNTSTVSLTMEQSEYCKAKPGGRSPFIRRLVSEYRAKADLDASP